MIGQIVFNDLRIAQEEEGKLPWVLNFKTSQKEVDQFAENHRKTHRHEICVEDASFKT